MPSKPFAGIIRHSTFIDIQKYFGPLYYCCISFSTQIFYILVNQNKIILYASFTAVFCNFFYSIIGFRLAVKQSFYFVKHVKAST